MTLFSEKTVWRFLKIHVGLFVISQMFFLPYLYYSQAHLHFINGTTVVHWHPVNEHKENTSKDKAPVSGHTHSWKEILQFSASQNVKGIPNVEIQVSLLYFPKDFVSPLEEIVINQIFFGEPTQRSPPVSFPF
ncbi:MAG TPA: hypothetical protein VM123_07035 [archaeon]|nr:hypothetical protein [archaeon]